jgi:hypothetical protein
MIELSIISAAIGGFFLGASVMIAIVKRQGRS